PTTPAADITHDSATAPHVTATTPTDGAAGVSSGIVVSATFSTAMAGATITTASFTLKRPDGTTVPATVAYDGPTTAARLTPTAALAGGTTYTAQVDATVTATVGTPLQSAVSWTFTTGSFFVVSTFPADGAQSAPHDAAVTATFSADADAATITSTTFSLTDSTGATV